MKPFLRLFSFIIVIVFASILVSMGRVESPVKTIMDRPNTTYRINKAYDLEGKTVKIPKNCTIVFGRRGKIYNGKLIGNNTAIECKKKALGVTLLGNWIISKISDEWFDHAFLSDDEIMENISFLQSDKIQQTITIKSKEIYNCSLRNSAVLRLSSNTTLYLGSTIQLQPTDLGNYSIISIRNKENVKVSGGKLIGDVPNHLESTSGNPGEWGMGVRIINSKNVTIENVTIRYCWGDGIYVGGHAEKNIGLYDNASKNIILKNVVCENNRRQGMSVTHVDGLYVNGCSFINTGKTKFTRPGAGVDIEPNVEDGQNESCRNIAFKKCTFSGNKGEAFFQYNSLEKLGVLNIENISLEKCSFSGMVAVCVPSITFKSCELEDLFIYVNSSPVNALFKNCIIVSNKSQIRTKAPKSNYKGLISVEMVGCRITLNDAKDWMDNQTWKSIDDLKLKKCVVSVPERVRGYKKVDAINLGRITGNSQMEYMK